MLEQQESRLGQRPLVWLDCAVPRSSDYWVAKDH